jgi:hypothetical protein
MKGGTNPYRLIKNGQSNARFPIILWSFQWDVKEYVHKADSV